MYTCTMYMYTWLYMDMQFCYVYVSCTCISVFIACIHTCTVCRCIEVEFSGCDRVFALPQIHTCMYSDSLLIYFTCNNDFVYIQECTNNICMCMYTYIFILGVHVHCTFLSFALSLLSLSLSLSLSPSLSFVLSLFIPPLSVSF